MTVAEAVADRLLSLSAVTALVSTRVYVFKIPQSERRPLIRVQRITDQQDMHLRGSVGLLASRVQVDSYAAEASGVDPYAVARSIDEAVHGDGAGSGLCGFQGGIGSPAFEIAAILPISVREEYDPEESRVVRFLREYEVWHRG